MRVIYYYIAADAQIYLLTVSAKADVKDLTHACVGAAPGRDKTIENRSKGQWFEYWQLGTSVLT
jgi:hypothetical protein